MQRELDLLGNPGIGLDRLSGGERLARRFVSEAPERPGAVTSDQGFGVAQALSEYRAGLRVAGVTERHRNVAEEAGVFRPPNWAVSEAVAETFLVETH